VSLWRGPSYFFVVRLLTMQLTSDTQICLSLSARPGGFGNRFHNYLYGELKLDFVYRGGATSNLKSAIEGLRGLGIRGCGLSMPYKEQALGLLDEVDPVARRIGAVNTIVNEDVKGAGKLVGYNTDATAVFEILKGRKVGPASRVALAGAGGMARACAYALSKLGCREVTVLARDLSKAKHVAGQYEFKHAELSSPKAGDFDVLINATPIGMTPDPPGRLPFTEEVIRSAKLAVECVATPARTSFVGIARDAGLVLVEGFDITVTQAVEQFRLYTGVVLRPDQTARGAVYARHQK
jgi:shikimate dehydrogenase